MSEEKDDVGISKTERCALIGSVLATPFGVATGQALGVILAAGAGAGAGAYLCREIFFKDTEYDYSVDSIRNPGGNIPKDGYL